MVSETVEAVRWGDGSHPLLDGVATMVRTLDEMTTALAGGSDPSWLTPADQGAYLAGLQGIEQRVTTMKQAALSALAGRDGVASETGARSVSDWLAQRAHANPRRLAAEAQLGARTAVRRHLYAAMLDGFASPDHARVVTECLDGLPTDVVDDDTVESAELVLVDYCREFTPAQVRRLGRHLLEVVAPEQAEQIEAEKLARAERDAWRRTSLSTRPVGEGFVRITADVPALQASILETVLGAIANPTRTGADAGADAGADDGQHLSAAHRRGRAFCTLLENLDTSRLPQRHGTAVGVTVLVDESALRRDLTAHGLTATTTGVDVTLEQARRLMCNAGIWPTVMGGASVVLDAGRTRRYVTGGMRKALEVAHTSCQADGCTIPAAWCDGHHRTAWSAGGRTRLDDSALLCHRRAHDPRYETRWSGSVATFHLRR